MNDFYRHWMKPLLFRFDPEFVHHQTLQFLAWLKDSSCGQDFTRAVFPSTALPTQVCGLTFPNPLGLAAGMDKNGIAIPTWEAMGFGFCEMGGVTRFPQPGNPKPRLFRVPQTEAIINRMGFNNIGADAVLSNLPPQGRPSAAPLAINIGKSKRTPLERAHEDFCYTFERLWEQGDLFVINVSSPNTPGLRTLQDRSALHPILKALVNANKRKVSESVSGHGPKPLFVKISPDRETDQINEIVDLCMELELDGIVATNTTTQRPSPNQGSRPMVYDRETGGLSGQPLRRRSTEVIRQITSRSHGKLTVIGVGGIDGPESAWEKIAAGASLCQIYSGLIFRGPGIIRSIVNGLQAQLRHHDFKSLKEAVGSNRPYQVEPKPLQP